MVVKEILGLNENSNMREILKVFLEAGNLDTLQILREELGELASGERDIISSLLEDWSERQALANILLYPELIPVELKFQSLLKGLTQIPPSYLTLVTIVGLEHLDFTGISPEQEAELVDKVIELAARTESPIAGRASAFLASYINTKIEIVPSSYKYKLVGLLDNPGETVKHNILVALIPLVGLSNLSTFLEENVKNHKITESSRQYVQQKLVGVKGLSADGRVDIARLDLGSLEMPLLAYIPDLAEWESRYQP